MAFGGSGGGGVRSEINITPLVDVVLVLLIIFMVMTPTLLKELDVTVPEKADVQMATPTTTDQIVITINKEGKVAINHEPINLSQLSPRIHDLMMARSEKLVFFDVDDDAVYEDVVHVMDACRGSGARVLGIMTK